MTSDDVVPLYEAIGRNGEALRQWLPWLAPDYSLEDMRRFIEKCEAENEARQGLTAVLCRGDEIVGRISLRHFDEEGRSASIGYWLQTKYSGQGLMTRACRAIMGTGFREYGLHRIEIRCAVDNHRSGAIPRRLGFREEGVLREAEWRHNRWVDLLVFGMLEQDWK